MERNPDLSLIGSLEGGSLGWQCVLRAPHLGITGAWVRRARRFPQRWEWRVYPTGAHGTARTQLDAERAAVHAGLTRATA